jgi:uncharacterized protein (UPF0332 family)
MSFDWTGFLTLAEALHSDPNLPGPPEAALRSAASRAYYAAFHCAVDFGCNEGFMPKHSGEDHHKIRSHFRRFQPSNPIRGKIAIELGRLYDLRRKADYSNTIGPRPISLAANAIGMAKSVIEKLACLSLPENNNSRSINAR